MITSTLALTTALQLMLPDACAVFPGQWKFSIQTPACRYQIIALNTLDQQAASSELLFQSATPLGKHPSATCQISAQHPMHYEGICKEGRLHMTSLSKRSTIEGSIIGQTIQASWGDHETTWTPVVAPPKPAAKRK